MLLTADTVVTGQEVLRPGWIEVSGAQVVEVGSGSPVEPADIALGAATIVPGFVDTHVHGGAGFDFSTADPSGIAAAVALHARHGTTTLIASLVSLAPADLIQRVQMLGELVQDGLIAGIHLEGPWLAAERCGAHDPRLLRDPDIQELSRLVSLTNNAIRMITIAPERHGALSAISHIAEAGVVAAVGHTDTDHATTRAAINAGATVATHLFNGMRPIHHRRPGPVLALLDDQRVTLELIADGTHFDPALYRHALVSAGSQRISLITDAMAAAGMPDGPYRLGALSVDVVDQVARISGSGTIAGSTATMDRIFRFSIAHSGLAGDAALLCAAQQTSINPARALGLPSPSLVSGGPAHLVVLDRTMTVARVMLRGAWVPD